MGERLSAAKLSKAPKDAEPPDEAPSAVELCRKGQGVADAKACDTHQEQLCWGGGRGRSSCGNHRHKTSRGMLSACTVAVQAS